MTSEIKELLGEFKKRMHATLVASSESCSLADFCRDFQSDWGSKKPVKWYAEQAGFPTVMQMLESMPSEVSIAGDMLTVVAKEETKQNKNLIDRSQTNKFSNQKKRKGNVRPPVWANNPTLRSTSLLDSLPPALPGLCRSTAAVLPFAAVPPPHFASNFFRPPVAVSQPVWSFASNWPNAMSFTSIAPPGYIGSADPRPNHPQWSSIKENHLQHGFGGFRPPNVSNVGAPLGPGCGSSNNLYATSLPSTSVGEHNVFTRNPSVFPANDDSTTLIVRNQLDGQSEKVATTPTTAGKSASTDNKSSTNAFRLHRSLEGTSLEEMEEGEIVDEVSEPFFNDCTLLTERYTPTEVKDDEEYEGFSSYNAKSEVEECRQLLANIVIRRIPSKIHRIVLLLKAAGETMTLKELQAEYEKKYARKLTNIELRNVLGTPEARNTLVAFQQSPLAFLFHYELTIGGNVRVRLNVDPEDMDKLDTAVQNHCDGFIGSTSINTRASVSFVSSSTLLSNNDVSTFQRPAVDCQRAVLSSTVTSPMPSVSEIPLPPGTPRPPVIIDEKKPSYRMLNQPAKDLLALATTAYDLASTERKLPSLHRELKKQTAFRAFTHSPAQLLGLLMKHFKKCFAVNSVRDGGQRMHLVIKSTNIRPADMIDEITKFPQLLYAFPSVVEFLEVATPTYAFLVSYQPVEFGKLRFIVNLAMYEKTRTSLRNFLEDYGRILRESKEATLKVDTLMDGQCVLYLSSKTLRRCRVVKKSQSLRDLRLQCMDRGRIYEKLSNSIFEFPLVSKLSPEIYPALAVRCELMDDLSNNTEEATALFHILKNEEEAIKINIIKTETDPFDNNETLNKVEMFVAGKDRKFKRWPANN